MHWIVVRLFVELFLLRHGLYAQIPVIPYGRRMSASAVSHFSHNSLLYACGQMTDTPTFQPISGLAIPASI